LPKSPNASFIEASKSKNKHEKIGNLLTTSANVKLNNDFDDLSFLFILTWEHRRVAASTNFEHRERRRVWSRPDVSSGPGSGAAIRRPDSSTGVERNRRRLASGPMPSDSDVSRLVEVRDEAGSRVVVPDDTGSDQTRIVEVQNENSSDATRIDEVRIENSLNETRFVEIRAEIGFDKTRFVEYRVENVLDQICDCFCSTNVPFSWWEFAETDLCKEKR
jgi:hypothetical protein